MTGKEYQDLAMRTNDGMCDERLWNSLTSINYPRIGEMINASLGLSGETGELNDMVKKYIYHKHVFDSEAFKKELGDICWYVALMCHACGYDLEDIMQKNIEKLKARYPEGFDPERSRNRKEGTL